MRLRDRKRIFDKWVRGESICDLAYLTIFDKLPSDQSVWCVEAIIREGLMERWETPNMGKPFKVTLREKTGRR